MRGQNPQGTHRNVMRRAGQYGAGGRHGRANNGNPGRDAAASLGAHTVRLIYPQERSPLPAEGETMKLTPQEADMKKYLNGSHWMKFCARYRASDRLQTCFACGQENVVLHHRTYERLGRERLADVVPVCQAHHIELHKLVNRGEVTLWDAHKALKQLAYPLGSVSRKHPEGRDLRNWRLGDRARKPGSGVKKRKVSPEEAQAMVEAGRSVRRRPIM